MLNAVKYKKILWKVESELIGAVWIKKKNWTEGNVMQQLTVISYQNKNAVIVCLFI